MPTTVLWAPSDFQTLRRPCHIQFEVVKRKGFAHKYIRKRNQPDDQKSCYYAQKDVLKAVRIITRKHRVQGVHRFHKGNNVLKDYSTNLNKKGLYLRSFTPRPEKGTASFKPKTPTIHAEVQPKSYFTAVIRSGTTTWIQISRQTWNGFFSNASNQIMIWSWTPKVSR